MSSRYASIFNISSDKIDHFISIDRDSRFPYTRWGTRIHKEVFPLEGINSEILPEGCVGYKLDSTCNASSWNGNAYAYTSLNPLFCGDTSSQTGTTFISSVYCYVSPDYNGSRVWLGAEGNSSGRFLAIYDTLKKGEWQKLSLDFKHEVGLAPVYMYMSKTGESHFGNLKGYVIFAYPEYSPKTLNHIDTISYFRINHNERNHIRSGFFSFGFQFQNDSVQNNHDSFILKDGAELSIPRSERMRYSLHIFKNEYSTKQKIFGGGFRYLEKFGTKFGSVELDYPHNPIISTFLYSGVLGGILYVIFLLLGAFYYIKYLKFHLYFFICYLVVFFFSILSANTHFSIPVFTFLSIVPFLTHALVQKERLKRSHEA